MDFETALEIKLEMGDTYVVEGIPFKLFVTPALPLEFQAYCEKFDMDTFDDESAQKFCCAGKYEVRAIRVEDGEVKWEYPELMPL